jgi:hypothetical protein
LRSSVRWRAFLANAPTLSGECRVEHRWVYQPGQFDGIAAPTLLLAGSESPPESSEATRLAVAAIPGAQIRVLDGHGHFGPKDRPRHGREDHSAIHLVGVAPAGSWSVID